MSPQNRPSDSRADDGRGGSSGPPYRAMAMLLFAGVVAAVAIGLVQLASGGDDEPPEASQTTSVEQPADGQDPAGAEGGANGEASPGVLPGADENAPPPEGAPEGGETAPDGPPPDPRSIPVTVYNNSQVSGLAARTGDTLRGAGFAVGEVGNLPSDQAVLSQSVVLYGPGPGEQQAAEAIAAELGIGVQPRPESINLTEPVIVITTTDMDG